MPKIKPPVKTPRIDMTPLVDLFSLLLVFFILTASFRPMEAALINTPSSISEKQGPDKNIMTIYIDQAGQVFYNIDNGSDTSNHYREKILKDMGDRYDIKFTPQEISRFGKLASFGMPIKDLRAWIDTKDSKEREKMQTGIPMDSTDNQLDYWVFYSKTTNPYVEAAIKGDAEANYTVVKKVMDILQKNKINKFNLITNLQKEEVKIGDLPK
jgi:biopolymer transport protein ExbD